MQKAEKWRFCFLGNSFSDLLTLRYLTYCEICAFPTNTMKPWENGWCSTQSSAEIFPTIRILFAEKYLCVRKNKKVILKNKYAHCIAMHTALNA